MKPAKTVQDFVNAIEDRMPHEIIRGIYSKLSADDQELALYALLAWIESI